MARTREQYNAYMLSYQKRRGAERREQANEYLGGSCTYCGVTEKLEIDHIDPGTKSFDIGERLWNTSWPILMMELEKCQLLCRTCHMQKSKEEQSVPHGGGMSGKRNCRCELCKAKKSEYNKNYQRSSVR